MNPGFPGLLHSPHGLRGFFCQVSAMSEMEVGGGCVFWLHAALFRLAMGDGGGASCVEGESASSLALVSRF